ncbi:MAG: hypothetical protein KIT25_07305 [Enhydrobacter sp.]|nr:MAG: hypothetical protein KIT25_07305 [Enhydrobacter sp.]
MSEESWPADTRAVRTAFLASEEGKARPDATPRFILAQGDKVVLATTGNGGWKDQMWPKILEVTATKA